jgi:hypothetical protein
MNDLPLNATFDANPEARYRAVKLQGWNLVTNNTERVKELPPLTVS